MAGITLEQAQARLDQYMAAEERILLNQTYQIDGKTFTMTDLPAVQEGIKLWSLRVSRISNGGIRRRYVVPE